jgi:hypothetical protein
MLVHICVLFFFFRGVAANFFLRRAVMQKKYCLNRREWIKKSSMCVCVCVTQRSALYATESSIYANMCYVHYKCQQSSAKKKIKCKKFSSFFFVQHPPTHLINSLIRLTERPASEMTSFSLIAFVITFLPYMRRCLHLSLMSLALAHLTTITSYDDSAEAFQLHFPVFI